MLQKFKDGFIAITWALDCLRNRDTWEFFNAINSGWSEMEFTHRYGDNPTEQDYWEWMMLNPQTIYLSEEDFDTLVSRLDILETESDYYKNISKVLNRNSP